MAFFSKKNYFGAEKKYLIALLRPADIALNIVDLSKFMYHPAPLVE